MNNYVDYLQHHGIKGMRWGVRRFQNNDGSFTRRGRQRYEIEKTNELATQGIKRVPPSYSDEQGARDAAIYGRGGERRIRRNVERNGIPVSGARSIEARRIAGARERAKSVGRGMGTIGGLVGGVAGFGVAKAIKAHGGQMARKYLGGELGESVGSLIDSVAYNPIASGMATGTIVAGMMNAGSQIARNGSRSISMIMSGYSPDKLR